MKCPKCGYNSFDHLESCKKCGEDMAALKAKFGLRSLFFGGGNSDSATAGSAAIVAAPEEGEPDIPEETVAPDDYDADSIGEEVVDEDPLEAPLDELLGADRPEEGDELPGAFQEETVDPGLAPEKQPLWKDFDGSALEIADPARPLSESSGTGEPFSRDEVSEEGSEEQGKSGFPEANLAELFLESLDGFDDIESTEELPVFFVDEEIFEKNSPEVTVVEPERQELEETAAEETVESDCRFKPPPLTSRIGAGVTDLIILAMIFILFLAAGEVALGSDLGGGPFPSLPSLLELAIPYFLVLFSACFGYFTLFHFLIGQTPGKMLFRIRVVGEEGDGLMFSQAFLRSVGGLLSLLPAGLGFLHIVLDRNRRGWNDRLANSRVVPVVGWEGVEEWNDEGLIEEEF